MNYVLIAVNVLIFLVTYWPHRDLYTGSEEALRPWVDQFMLTPVRPNLWQFVSYAFLHGGLMHIIGNMFFLYLFGNNVNDKLGHIGYLCFYLAGAVFSGVGHTLFNSSSTIPTLGASGAIAAVTGAYLVLFPQTLITVLYWFYIIGTDGGAGIILYCLQNDFDRQFNRPIYARRCIRCTSGRICLWHRIYVGSACNRPD